MLKLKDSSELTVEISFKEDDEGVFIIYDNITVMDISKADGSVAFCCLDPNDAETLVGKGILLNDDSNELYRY